MSKAGAARAAVLTRSQAMACERWQQPEMGEGSSDSARMLTASELEQLRARAYEEAFDRGLQEGRAAGRAEARAQAQRLAGLVNLLARPLEALDDQVETELVTLTVAIAKQLIRRELRTERGQIVAVVREALAILPVGVRDVKVHLHPEDAELLRSLLPEAEEQPSWRIVEDPVLSRGGCLVRSESSQVDARLEKRIGTIVSMLLGGERSQDDRRGE